MSQTELHEHFRRSLERERDPKLLGWAMFVIHASDHRNGWNVIKDVDFSLGSRESDFYIFAKRNWHVPLQLIKGKPNQG